METSIDLTPKEETSFWSCFQVCFPQQHPPSSKIQKSVSFAPNPNATEKLDLGELESCLDQESPATSEDSLAKKNNQNHHSSLTELWRYIITVWLMGFMSRLQRNKRLTAATPEPATTAIAS